MDRIEKPSGIKIKIQYYILIGGLLLFVLKIIAFCITNSVSILSDALESTVNIITGFMTLKSLQFAAKPRDDDHPYGHGKIELITASVEGILIGVAGIFIIKEAINRLGQTSVLTDMDMGLFIMILTALANYYMGHYSELKGKKMHSIALISGGKHLKSDTYTTLALIGGLLVYYITGKVWVDSVLALIFGAFIIYTGYEVLKTTTTGLMDETDKDTIEAIVQTIKHNKMASWINIHKLTYLKFGHVSHVDLHFTLPWFYSLKEGALEINHLKEIIRKKLPEDDVDISIQSEPCEPVMCHHCSLACLERKHPFVEEITWTTEHVTGKNMYNNLTKSLSNA